jgi:hypothetical protein
MMSVRNAHAVIVDALVVDVVDVVDAVHRFVSWQS